MRITGLNIFLMIPVQTKNISSDQWEMTEHILSKLRQGSRDTIEQLYRQEILPDTDFFPLRMHKSRLIDRYIREWFREKEVPPDGLSSDSG